MRKETKLLALSANRSTGLIAQDVEKIIQELGFTAINAIHAPSNETDNYSLGYAQFVVPLVKAVQEQQEQINLLKDENMQLKNQCESLKAVQERMALLEAKLNKFIDSETVAGIQK